MLHSLLERAHRLRCAAIALVVSTALLAGNAAYAVGSTDIRVTDNYEEEQRPAVAYSSKQQIYAVASEQHHGIYWGWFIGISRVKHDGTMLVDYKLHHFNAEDRMRPDIAYNSKADQFLVVWQEEYTAGGSDHDIRGILIKGDGYGTVGWDFNIAYTADFECAPRVAYNPKHDEYLVVFQLDVYANSTIWGQRISAAGVVTGPAFQVSGDWYEAKEPALAYDPPYDDYLVVWQGNENPATEHDIGGRWVKANASGSFYGDAFTISSWQYDQVKPKLAFHTAKNQFLVVWEDRHWGWGAARDIYGQIIHSSGAFDGGNFAISWLGTQPRTSPAVYYTPSKEYRVVWEYANGTDNRIYSRGVSSTKALAPEAAVSNRCPTCSSSVTSVQYAPAAVGDGISEGLVVWEDDYTPDYSGTSSDIYGTLY